MQERDKFNWSKNIKYNADDVLFPESIEEV
jgi:hypothetical protein